MEHGMRRLSLLLLVAACGGAADDENDISTQDDALTPGVNGGACKFSPYNCKLRVNGDNPVDGPSDGWTVKDGPVVDGNGDLIGMNTRDHLDFNYGQDRRIGDHTWVMARSTSTGSAGWFREDLVVSESVLRSRVGEVNAKDTHGDRTGCYQIRNSHDETLAEKKVVYDTTEAHERAGDYLPLPRSNNVRYANLAFSVPGSGLGAPAIDIYPAGTHFQRIDVPTNSGRPSLDVPLWVKDGAGRYRQRSGSLKFIYGYVLSKPGDRRFGWMAYPALTPSSGCK
jgi:hypothetical protein